MPINYETDPLKHYVRKHGWLTAARQQKQSIRNRPKNIPLRYFTFCAEEAIDVFLLEREGILERSEDTGRLEGVYFCESDHDKFGIIADLIGSPEQGFQGEFEKIVLFEDDDDTREKTVEDEEFHSAEVRRKLRYKDAHLRLREAFPFDIINLDVCGVMFPPRKVIITQLVQSIFQIIDWQTKSNFPINDLECNQFTLFLTSHVNQERTNQAAIQLLEDLMIDNMRTSGHFRSAFIEQYGHDQVKKLVNENFPEFFSLALLKFIIRTALYDSGWEVIPSSTYLFHRDNKWDKNNPYQIMHAVSVYKRIRGFRERDDVPNTSQYIQSVTQMIKNGVEWVDSVIKSPGIHQLLKEDLKQIVALRKMRSGI